MAEAAEELGSVKFLNKFIIRNYVIILSLIGSGGIGIGGGGSGSGGSGNKETSQTTF